MTPYLLGTEVDLYFTLDASRIPVPEEPEFDNIDLTADEQ